MLSRAAHGQRESLQNLEEKEKKNEVANENAERVKQDNEDMKEQVKRLLVHYFTITSTGHLT